MAVCGFIFQLEVFAQGTPQGSARPAAGPSSGGTRGPINEETQVKVKVQRNTQKVVKNEFSGTGFGLFGGADLGMVFTSPLTSTYKRIESSQLGFAPAFKFGASVFTQRIILDASLGLHYSRYSGKIVSLPQADDFGEITFVPYNESYNRTQLGLHVDAGARLRIKQEFQLGLLGGLIFRPNPQDSVLFRTSKSAKNTLHLSAPNSFTRQVHRSTCRASVQVFWSL
jgi:hypothetical protein